MIDKPTVLRCYSPRLLATLGCGFLLAAGTVTHAQVAPGTGGRGDFRNLTPPQRQQLTQQMRDIMRDATLRIMLNNAGVADKTVQDAIVNFAATREQATQALRQEQRKVMQAVNNPGNTRAAEMAILLDSWQGALDTEMQRRKTAEAALDAAINFSKQPRLEAVLTTLGLLGDEMAIAGESSVVGSMPGGFDAFGGLDGMGTWGGLDAWRLPRGLGGAGGPGGMPGGDGGGGGRRGGRRDGREGGADGRAREEEARERVEVQAA